MQHIKLGSRDSALALVQANAVKGLLGDIGITAEIITCKSDGDINLVQPLYEMGIQGIFTKVLDTALLNRKIDLAVHSLKDVPTKLPKGLVICAVPQRANPFDVLLPKKEFSFDKQQQVIATSSLRRGAQWRNKFPGHSVENIRGNVPSRIQKFEYNNSWHGVIFAKAGLDRLQIDYPNAIILDWMIPAPAQGALAVVCREEDTNLIEATKQITDINVWHCVHAERQFLEVLHGGCSVPIACYAHIDNGMMHIEGCILSEDGTEKLSEAKVFNQQAYSHAGKLLAEALITKGAQKIIDNFRKSNN